MPAPFSLLLGAYGLAWKVAIPLLRRRTRLKDGFAERLVPAEWPLRPSSLAKPSDHADEGVLRLWLQAASGGEAWLLHSLVPALLRELDAMPLPAARRIELLCTSCTRQGLDILEKIPPRLLRRKNSGCTARLLARYLPLDEPGLMRRAMRQAAPSALILLETELWPGLLAAAREERVPVHIINGRMTEKSRKAYRLLGRFLPEHAPEQILAVSEADAGRFASVFGAAGAVSIMPNIKFDRMAEDMRRCEEEGGMPLADKVARDATPGTGQPPLRVSAPGGADACALTGLADPALLAVFASVRKEEEELLLPVIRSLYTRAKPDVPLAIAIAPRHMHRVAFWRQKLRQAGLPCSLRSSMGAGQDPVGACPAIVLWDSFGELRQLYAAADVAFVGGSLAPLGGQNFLEALAQGGIPLVGPHLKNFLWVGEDLFTSGLVIRVRDSEELLARMGAALERRGAVLASMAESRRNLERSGTGPTAPARTLEQESWAASRADLAAQVQKRFADWLAPRTGGSATAARAIARSLALFSGSGYEERHGSP
ncbi:3-deoxy-D-manno-octulosonic acid transferase [Desulfovibrio sp. OttesenSCG-928-A18]|nr:3-deoxy-D-manno-octulosonic acid transferase [Desulfovibrio sp. OttesenSCG-928-A18]